eukprot:13614239-Alexandrium_andersonii.AAC.1
MQPKSPGHQRRSNRQRRNLLSITKGATVLAVPPDKVRTLMTGQGSDRHPIATSTLVYQKKRTSASLSVVTTTHHDPQ